MLLFFIALLGPAVTISPAPDGEALLADYQLEEAVREWSFAPRDTPQRADAWTPVGEGWVFDGRTVTRADGGAFRSFKLRLAPDPKFHDRLYVAADRVGKDGWVLFLASLGGAGPPIRLSFDGFGERAALKLPGAGNDLHQTMSTDANDSRVAYVGPAEYVHEGPVTLIYGPELPDWIAQGVNNDVAQAIDVLTDRLSAQPSQKPAVIFTYDAERNGEGRRWKGGALDGATFVLRLRGDYDRPDEETARWLSGFAVHETVHLWNSEIWTSSGTDKQPWLHEGAAEYLADRLTLRGEPFRKEAERHFNGCAVSLGDKALDGSTGPVYGKVPYDCGFILQLAAELTSQKKRRGDILDLWRSVFEASEDGVYSPEAFLKAAEKRGGKTFGKIASLLLQTQGSLRWLALGDALDDIGVKINTRAASAEDGDRLVSMALMSFMGSICNGTHGWYGHPDFLKFETGDRCGDVLKGDPEIFSVNGASLTNGSYQAYLEIRNACQSGGKLVFAGRDGAELPALSCTADIPDPAAVSALDDLPRLPELSRNDSR